MSNTEMLLKLITENPELPVIPLVDADVVGDDYGNWIGMWGRAEIKEIYPGRERLHVKDEDDEEDVLCDLVGCRYLCDSKGRDIYDLSDEEWASLYASVPWEKAIVVHITA